MSELHNKAPLTPFQSANLLFYNQRGAECPGSMFFLSWGITHGC